MLRLFAWGVHLYTAMGFVCAAGMAVLIVQGDDDSFRGAFGLMILATLIDATDGTLARLVRIKETLPGFDGRRLDDLVDILTFVCLPLLLVWRAKLLPDGYDVCLLLPLLASGYGFCQVQAKTPDGYFRGFPSYWNIVACYLYLLRPWWAWLSVTVVVTLALLTFVPSRYLYPSQKGRLNLWATLLAVPWTLMLGGALWLEGAGNPWAWHVALVSLYYPIWYLAVSWWVTLRQASRRTPQVAG